MVPPRSSLANAHAHKSSDAPGGDEGPRVGFEEQWEERWGESVLQESALSAGFDRDAIEMDRVLHPELKAALLSDRPDALERLLNQAQAQSIEASRTSEGLSALMVASVLGSVACVKTLMPLRSQHWDSTPYGSAINALGLAAAHGQTQCVRVLLDGGALSESPHRAKALLLAVENGHLDCVQVLIEAFAHTHPEHPSLPPVVLKRAIEGPHENVLELVLCATDLSSPSLLGQLLKVAAQTGNPHALRHLLTRSPETLNPNDKKTILLLAVQSILRCEDHAIGPWGFVLKTLTQLTTPADRLAAAESAWRQALATTGTHRQGRSHTPLLPMKASTLAALNLLSQQGVFSSAQALHWCRTSLQQEQFSLVESLLPALDGPAQERLCIALGKQIRTGIESKLPPKLMAFYERQALLSPTQSQFPKASFQGFVAASLSRLGRWARPRESSPSMALPSPPTDALNSDSTPADSTTALHSPPSVVPPASRSRRL